MTMWARLCKKLDWFKKKTDARKLYEQVGHFASLKPTTICMLHEAEPRTPCPESNYFCGKESKHLVFNFDAVKEAYCRNTKTQSWSSVDAALYKSNRFLFVEIKSWQNFERHQIDKNDSEAAIKKKIEEQAKGFKLKTKIEKSVELCRKISNDEHLFEKMPVTYVLVTDVDTVVDPLARFRGRLRVLAYKSVYIPLYSSASQSELAAVGMDVRYVFCQKFDEFYDSL